MIFKELPAFAKLIDQLRRIPYLASKNVFKVATHFLSSDENEVARLVQVIEYARKQVKKCSRCTGWTESVGPCVICRDPGRDAGTVCVVETWHDMLSIERSGNYRGQYHVLGAVLCPLEGVGPEHLSIHPLIGRLESEPVTEVIFATNPTPEGEATASYIASKIQNKSIKTSRLASGIPIGSTLEFMDRMTIHKALSGRQTF